MKHSPWFFALCPGDKNYHIKVPGRLWLCCGHIVRQQMRLPRGRAARAAGICPGRSSPAAWAHQVLNHKMPLPVRSKHPSSVPYSSGAWRCWWIGGKFRTIRNTWWCKRTAFYSSIYVNAGPHITCVMEQLFTSAPRWFWTLEWQMVLFLLKY